LQARTAAPADTRWVALSDLGGEALPSLMRKVVAHALPSETMKSKPRKETP